MMSDNLDIDIVWGIAQFLVITYDTAEEVKKAYEILKEGSTIIYPLKSTTYSSCFVSLIDKFGLRWGIMTETT
jgi:PhnB protein